MEGWRRERASRVICLGSSLDRMPGPRWEALLFPSRPPYERAEYGEPIPALRVAGPDRASNSYWVAVLGAIERIDGRNVCLALESKAEDSYSVTDDVCRGPGFV